MMISKESYLRFPPIDLEKRQTLVFNAITYNVDICNISYRRLYNELINFNQNPKSTGDNFPKIFADILSIIEYATKFLNIIEKYIDIASESSILNELKKAKKMRNTSQHLDERIDEILLSSELPLYGSLSWIRNIPNSNKYQQYILYSGVFTANLSKRIEGKLVSTKIESKDEIGDIIFEFIIKRRKDDFLKTTISIKKLISDIQFIIDSFNEQLDSQIKMFRNGKKAEVERHKTNLFVQLNCTRR